MNDNEDYYLNDQKQFILVNSGNILKNFEFVLENFSQNSFWKQLNLKLIEWFISLLDNSSNISNQFKNYIQSKSK